MADIKPPKPATKETTSRLIMHGMAYDRADYARYERESITVAVIQAIRDNADLRRELREALGIKD